MNNNDHINASKDKLFRLSISFLLLIIIQHLASQPIPTVYANEIGLRIEPSVLQIQSQIPGEIQTPFSIENLSSDQVTLKIGYKIINREASKDGIVTFLNDTDVSTGVNRAIFDKIQVIDEDNNSRDVVELGPKQKKKLQLRISLPKEIPSTDYYFTLVFAHANPLIPNLSDSYIDAEGQKSVSTIQTGIGLNVFMSTGPISYPQGNISEFSAPWYAQSGPIKFTAKVTNAGQHYINPKGEITIRNIIGQKVGSISIPTTLVLSGTTRNLTDDFRTTSNNTESTHIVWRDKLLLGYYTATIQLSLSPQGPYYTQTLQFIVFPFVPLLLIMCSIPLGLIIYIRIKRKLKW